MRSFFSSRIFLIIVTFLLLIAALIALLPTIASTKWGRKQVTAWVNRSIPGQLEIKNLDLAWFQGQKIEGLSLRDRQGNLIVDFQKLSTDATLVQLINKSTHLGHTQLQDFNAEIITDEKGISNLQKALGLVSEGQTTTIPPSTILVTNVNVDSSLFVPGQPLSFSVTGETNEEKLQGSFNISTILPGISSDNWTQLGDQAQKLLSIDGSKEATLDAQVNNFPVNLIDRIVALNNPNLNGLFSSILGEKLDIILKKEPSAEGLSFSLNIKAPSLQGDLKGLIVNDQLLLQQPANFQLNIKPETINPFIQKHFTFVDPTHVQFVVKELALPFAFFNKESDSKHRFGVVAHAQLDDKTHIQVPSLGEIQLLDLIMDVSSPLNDQIITIQVKGKAQDGSKQPIDLLFTSSLNKPENIKDLIEQLKKDSYANIKLSNIPAPFLVSKIQDQQEKVRKLLGSIATIDLDIKHKTENTFDLQASIKTEKLSIDKAHFQINNDKINALSPIIVEYKPEPTILNELLIDQPISIVEANPLFLNISNLEIPFNGKATSQIKALLSSDSLHVIHKPTSNAVQLKNIKLKAQGSSLSDIALDVTSGVSLLNPDGSLSPFLGDRGTFSSSAQLMMDPQGQLSLNNIKTALESDRADITLEGNLLPNNIFVLTQPLQVNYKLFPDLLEKMNILSKDKYPKLKNTPLIHFKIDPFQVNFKDIKPKDLMVKGSLDVDSLLLQSSPDTLTKLDNVAIPWEINTPLNMTRINVKAKASTEEHPKPGQLSIQLLMSNWIKEEKLDTDNLKIEISSTLVGLPTSLISSLIVKEDLTPLLGSILDLELEALIDQDQATPGYWDMVIDSPHLHVKARLMYTDAITLYETTSKSSVDIRWTLTPDGYTYLNKLFGTSDQKLKLASPVTFKTYFTDLYIPLSDTSSMVFDKAKFNAAIESNDIVWTDGSIPVLKLKGQLHSPNMIDQIEASLHATSKGSTSLALNSKIRNLFDKEGKKNWNQASIKADLQANQIPTSLLKTFSLLREDLQQNVKAVIGDMIDAQLEFKLHNMEGPLEGNIQGSNGDISLNGKLKKGVLFLEKPFVWNIKFTPELTKLFVQRNMPLLSSAIGMEEPIKLIIESKGTAIPVIPFDFDKVTIPKGALHLGKVRFKNEGELKSILNLLKPIPEDQFIIWFTPIYFQLAKSNMDLKRMDLFVADRYSLAAWGDMNLNSHKMNLTVGLTEQALRSALGIQGLDANYVFQIPVKGRNGKIEVDKGSVIARISALVAQSQADSKLKILGTVLDIATSGFKGSGAPDPTTNPLPWQNKIDEGRPKKSSETESTETESQPKNEGDRLMKEIEKGASSLFKNFLK